MKEVDRSRKQQISDLIFERGLRIAEFALEKDFIVTDVLAAISKVDHPQFDLVFCGGTCLSKAYGLLERVSEDVDIKIVPKAGAGLSANQRRAAMRGLKADMSTALGAIGFRAEDIIVSATDANSCVVFDAAYASQFETAAGMRANMKLELNLASLSLPTKTRAIGRLYDSLADPPGQPLFEMQCVDLREALVEKLLCFPRRLALHLSGSGRALDHTLVRHLYDVHQIANVHPESVADLDELSRLMLSAMGTDAVDFANQHPQFLLDPVGELDKAMTTALADPFIAEMYRRFIEVMVYGHDAPDFDAALARFSQILNAVKPAPGLSFG